MTFDPTTDAFAKDPYKFYAQLRADPSPYYYEAQNMWLITRYADIARLAQSPTMVRSLRSHVSKAVLKTHQHAANFHDMPYHERVVQSNLLDSDGETHRRLRNLVYGMFTRSEILRLQKRIHHYCDALLGKIIPGKPFDFIATIAHRLPGLVIGNFLGTPDEDAKKINHWTNNIVSYFDINRTNNKKKIAEEATQEFYTHLINIIESRKADPRNDLISHMVMMAASGAFRDDELISTIMLILNAGHGSSTDIMGNGLYALLRHPFEMKKLRENPALLSSAIEEMFRYDCPLPFFHRHGLEDIIISGKKFETGSVFGLLYGAANRDPTIFKDPDQFRIDRSPNRHLAFGSGAHLCLGNHLAKLSMKILFSALLQRYKTIELINENVPYKKGLSARGPIELIIQVATV